MLGRGPHACASCKSRGPPTPASDPSVGGFSLGHAAQGKWLRSVNRVTSKTLKRGFLGPWPTSRRDAGVNTIRGV